MPKHQKENILVVIRVAVLTLKNIPCSQGHTPPPPPPSPESTAGIERKFPRILVVCVIQTDSLNSSRTGRMHE